MAMQGEFHIFSNFVKGFDWRIETTYLLQIIIVTCHHLLDWLYVVLTMQNISVTCHHILDWLYVVLTMQNISVTCHHILDWLHTCRPSRLHRSEGIQATAGQHSVGSSHNRPTQPSPGIVRLGYK